jgi:hypothetical protein
MKVEVRSPQDHANIVQRMARSAYTRPYSIEVEWLDHRSIDQNSLMWSLLRDFSKGVEWPEGSGQYQTPETWKDLLTALLRGQKALPGLDGSIVFVGARTSKMSKDEMSELIDLIFAEGTTRGVEFTDITGEQA